MKAADLSFFTHDVEGVSYGAWYRVIGQTDVEVLAVGLMQTVPLAGLGAEEVARTVLEDFVRARSRFGAPLPTVQDVIKDT